jgi:hypothetical protein
LDLVLHLRKDRQMVCVDENVPAVFERRQQIEGVS